MSSHNKAVSVLLLCTLVINSFASVAHAQMEVPVTPAENATTPPLSSIPAFPEDEPGTVLDWSELDLNQEIFFHKDQEDFRREVERLEALGKQSEIKDIPLEKRKVGDEEVLKHFGAPEYVREIVKDFREDNNMNDKTQRENLSREIKKALIENNYFPENYKEQEKINELNKNIPILNIEDAVQGGKNFIPASTENQSSTIEIKQTAPDVLGAPAEPERFSREEITLKRPNRQGPRLGGGSLLNVPRALRPTPARPTTPKKSRLINKIFNIKTAYAADMHIIEYYEGIEDHAIEHMMHHLSQIQNEDGSFGTFNHYELTAEIALLLSRYDKIDNDQYALAVEYLINTAPANNREKAIKARLMIGLDEDFQDLIDELLPQQNPNGGFGLDKNYSSDVETTLEVIWMLWAADQGISDAVPAALGYIVNQIAANGNMYYTSSDVSSYYRMNKTLEYLAPFSDLTVASTSGSVAIQTKIDAILNYLAARYDQETEKLAESSDVIDDLMTLYSFQLNHFDIAKQKLLKQNAHLQRRFEGSYGTSLYAVIAGLKALADSELAITAVENTGDLVNGQPLSLEFTITNNGYRPTTNAQIYTFVDNFQLGDPINLGSNLTIEAGEEETIAITIPNTKNFIGVTNLKFYIEDQTELNYSDNWIETELTFAGPANGTPALPTYYVAHSYVLDNAPYMNVRWALKADANRNSYVIMFREQGTTTWNYINVGNNSAGAFVGQFPSDKTYEVNLGSVHQDESSVTHFAASTLVKTTADEQLYIGEASGFITQNNQPIPGLDVFTLGGGFTRTDSEGAFIWSDLKNGSNIAWVFMDPYEPLKTRYTMPVDGTTPNIRIFPQLRADDTDPVISEFSIRFSPNFIVKNQRNAQILAFGTDNIDVKETDFEYYDPATESWNYLGTVEDNGSSLFDWYLPGELFGEEYKVRATMWDYQGNSDTEEWGPFSIIDGTNPEGTTGVLSLDSNTWGLGDTKSVFWDLTLKNPLQDIDHIWLRYGTRATTITGTPNIANSTHAYTMPLNAEFASTSAYIEIEDVCDINANCVDLISEPFSIVDRTPAPHAPWGEPRQFLYNPSYTLYRTIDGVYMNDDGSIEVIYREYDGIYLVDPGQYIRIVHRKFANGQWGNPVVLKEYLYRIGVTARVNFQSVKTYRSAPGDIHVVYERTEGEGLESIDNTDVYYVHLQNGSVVSDRRFSTAAQVFGGSPEVTATSSGQVMAVWREGYSYVNKTGTSTLQYIQGNGTTTWSSVSQLTAFDPYRMTVIAESDEPTIIYIYNSQFYFIRRSGTTWSQPILLRNPSIPKAHLDIFTDDADKFPFIVQPDLQNPDQYLWLSTIKTKTDLAAILSANNFTKQAEILDAWEQNEFGFNMVNLKLFPLGNSTYDLFYYTANSHDKWLYNVTHLKFSINFTNATTTLLKYTDKIVETGPGREVRTFDIAQNAAKNYHLFYIERVSADDLSIASHLFYDGNKTYFDSNVTSLLMRADSNPGVHGGQNNNKVAIFFNTYLEGVDQPLYNTADFGPIIDYRINNIAPLNNATVIDSDIKLEWQTEGGAITSYDIYWGTSPFSMNLLAQDITTTTYTIPDVPTGYTYYWQIAGKHNGNTIYSNMFSFSANSCTPPAVGLWTIAQDCIYQTNKTAPGDVLIKNNALLIIEPTAVLNIDFIKHALRIENGSGVLVKQGGKIF